MHKRIIFNQKKKLKLKNLLLTEIADLVIKELGGNQCCVSMSWLVSTILSAYANLNHIPQLSCKPVFVSLLLVNNVGEEFAYKYYTKLVNQLRMGIEPNDPAEVSIFTQKMEKDKKVWSIGSLFNAENKDGLDQGFFHSVIVFPDKSILDMTIDQLCRPEKNLFIKRFWTKRENIPSPIILFKIEKVIDRCGAILYTLNFNKISNTVSKRIAEILGYEVIIFDKRINK